MIDDSAITEKEIDCGWKNQRLLVCVKSMGGKLFIDARKWKCFDGKYTPMNGLMLSLEHWPLAMKEITETLNANS